METLQHLDLGAVLFYIYHRMPLQPSPHQTLVTVLLSSGQSQQKSIQLLGIECLFKRMVQTLSRKSRLTAIAHLSFKTENVKSR